MSWLVEAAELCVVAAILVAGTAWAQDEMSADVLVSRHVQSGLLPVAGDYVQYDLTVTNSGRSEIAGQYLWVLLESEGGRTDSQASFFLPELTPGESVQVHVGPFKTLEAGAHRLYLGINSRGNPDQTDDVAIKLPHEVPADSFTVYSPALAVALPIGAGLTAAGTVILIFFSMRRS